MKKVFLVLFLLLLIITAYACTGDGEPSQPSESTYSDNASTDDSNDSQPSEQSETAFYAGKWGEIIGEGPQPVLDLKPGTGVDENGSLNYTINLNGYYIDASGVARTTNERLDYQEIADVRAVAHPTYRTAVAQSYYFLKNDDTLWGFRQNTTGAATELTLLLEDVACLYDLPSNDASRRYIKVVTNEGRIFALDGLEVSESGDPFAAEGVTAGYVSAPLHAPYYIRSDGTLWNEEELLIRNVKDVMTIGTKTYIIRGDDVLYLYEKEVLTAIKTDVASLFNGFALGKDGTLFDYNKGGVRVAENVKYYYWDGSYITNDNVLVKVYANVASEEIHDVVECWFGYDYNIVKQLWYVKSDGSVYNWYDTLIATGARVGG